MGKQIKILDLVIEVAQLYKNGKALMRFGQVIIYRNYTLKKIKLDVAIPSTNNVIYVKNLQTNTETQFELSDNKISFVAEEGDYAIHTAI